MSGADLLGGGNFSLSSDRNGAASSALDLNSGYRQAPTGVYFSSYFTVTVWAMLRVSTVNSRVIDFGNGNNIDTISISLTTCCGGYFAYFSCGSISKILTPSTNLVLNQWYFIAVVVDQTAFTIYLNGVIGQSTPSSSFPNNVIRNLIYIGKSNAGDPNTNSKIDDLKIFNRALSQAEILTEMSSYLH